ncbi:MAG: hypothetical protein IJD64_06470 [Clostridia bacterium]|nr:hypothetical protein [Clostridia bacterium]
MKKIFALILIAATLLLLCSCGMTADKLELRLEAMEENGDVFYVAMDKDELADEEEEILEDRQFQMKGKITQGYFVQDKKKITDFAYILVYEKTSDAKKAESFLTEDNESDPDFAAKRKGKLLFYGDAELIATILG